MGKKYLETKENSLESSVLGIWQEAAKKAGELDEAGEKISSHEQDLFDDDIFPALKKARYNNIKKLIQKTQKDKGSKSYKDLLKGLKEEDTSILGRIEKKLKEIKNG